MKSNLKRSILAVAIASASFSSVAADTEGDATNIPSSGQAYVESSIAVVTNDANLLRTPDRERDRELADQQRDTGYDFYTDLLDPTDQLVYELDELRIGEQRVIDQGIREVYDGLRWSTRSAITLQRQDHRPDRAAELSQGNERIIGSRDGNGDLIEDEDLFNTSHGALGIMNRALNSPLDFALNVFGRVPEEIDENGDPQPSTDPAVIIGHYASPEQLERIEGAYNDYVKGNFLYKPDGPTLAILSTDTIRGLMEGEMPELPGAGDQPALVGAAVSYLDAAREAGADPMAQAAAFQSFVGGLTSALPVGGDTPSFPGDGETPDFPSPDVVTGALSTFGGEAMAGQPLTATVNLVNTLLGTDIGIPSFGDGGGDGDGDGGGNGVITSPHGGQGVRLTAIGNVLARNDQCSVSTGNIEFNFGENNTTGLSDEKMMSINCGEDRTSPAQVYLSTTDTASFTTDGTDTVAGTIGNRQTTFGLSARVGAGSFSSIKNRSITSVSAASPGEINLRASFDRMSDSARGGGDVRFNTSERLYVYFQ